MAKAKKETNKETHKFVVIEPYYDSQLKRELVVGDELDLESERAQKLLKLKLIKAIVGA